MARKRVVPSSALKAKAALAAVQGRQTLGELASQFGVHPIQIGRWRQQLLQDQTGPEDENHAGYSATRRGGNALAAPSR